MKLTVVMLVMVVSCEVNASGAVVGRNILLNNDFDAGLSFWAAGEHSRWGKNVGINSTGAVFMDAPVVTDDGYIHEAKVEQCVQIGDADLFHIEAKFRYDSIPQNAYAHRLNYVWFTNDVCTIGGQYGGYLEPKLKEGWQTLSVNNARASLNAKSVKIELTQNQRASARQSDWLGQKLKWLYEVLGMEYLPPVAGAYWDEVLVAPAHIKSVVPGHSSYAEGFTRTAGENYLANGGFNSDGQGWRLSSSAQWIADYGYTVNGAIHTAVSSEKSGMGMGVFNQCVNLGVQRYYRMGVKYISDRRSTQRGGGRLRVTWYEDDGCLGANSTDTNHVDIQPVDGWQSLEVNNLERPMNAASAKITMIQSVSGAGTYAGYWDDAYFTVASDYRQGNR
jgi:hypothetical protein